MSLNVQFYTMLSMVGMGIYLGAALDTYGRFLKRPIRSRLIVFINDVLFWLTQALFIFYILLSVNQGELRLYIFLALLCGFAAYQSLFMSIYLQILEAIIRAFIALYRFLYRTTQILVVKPIILLVKFLFTILVSIWTVTVILLKFLWKVFLYMVKIVFTPVRLLGILVVRLLPERFNAFVLIYIHRFIDGGRRLKKWYKGFVSKWDKKE